MCTSNIQTPVLTIWLEPQCAELQRTFPSSSQFGLLLLTCFLFIYFCEEMISCTSLTAQSSLLQFPNPSINPPVHAWSTLWWKSRTTFQVSLWLFRACYRLVTFFNVYHSYGFKTTNIFHYTASAIWAATQKGQEFLGSRAARLLLFTISMINPNILCCL